MKSNAYASHHRINFFLSVGGDMSAWLKRFVASQKPMGRFHPIWIVLAAALTLIVAGIVLVPALIVPKVEIKTPSLSPSTPKVILVRHLKPTHLS